MRSESPSSILLLDDQPDILYYFKHAIQRFFPTYTTYTCQTSADAFAHLCQETTSCVITDYALAREDSSFLIHIIHRRWPTIPVVLITGLEPAHMKFEASQCAAVLLKPISLTLLRTTLQPLLQ